MEQPKKELIRGIADLFEDYEEAYVPGEWEAFSQHKKKKYPFVMTWVKVAAILTLVLSALFFTLRKPAFDSKNTAIVIHTKDNGKQNETVKGSSVQSGTADASIKEEYAATHSLQSGKQSSSVANRLNIPAQHSLIPANAVNHVHIVPAEDSIQIPPASAVDVKSENTDTRTAKLSVPNTGPEERTAAEKPKLSTLDFLTAESKTPAEKVKKKTTGSKWDFGLEVVPSVTQKNTNLGAGLTTAYHLSDKFSLSSGLTMMKMQSGTIVMPVNPAAAVSGFSRDISARELRAVDANIRAIDIPLGLVYKVTKNYYTSIGVSYFNVLSEKRSNTYVQTSQVNATVSDPQTGNSFSYKSVITEEVAESSLDEPLKGNSYLGFVNFSIGRRQTIFNKYNILLEPFIKVPVGKLSSQDIKLMNSGLKLQVSF